MKLLRSWPSLFFVIALFSFFGWKFQSNYDVEKIETAHVELLGSKSWRSPSAINKDADFSNLSGQALWLAGQDRLLRDLKWIEKDGEIGIELGHFVLSGSKGQKEFACQHYDSIEVVFQAEGMASSGDVPAMTIEAPCEVSKNIHKLEPIWIPKEKFLSGAPSDYRNYLSDDERTAYNLKGVDYAWPKQWRLKEIRLFHKDHSERELKFSKGFRGIASEELQMNW